MLALVGGYEAKSPFGYHLKCPIHDCYLYKLQII